ncbi:MAG: MFS transporter [Clostridia bacterium]|nr:MFS transporter [Clostridia bacterium]
MKNYLSQKHASLLVFACWLVYTAAYVGRLDYSASMVKIIAQLGITNDQGGTVYSCFALTYGIGQLVNGLLCKYYNPKYVITGALSASALINLLMPLSGDWRMMALLWLCNGIVQSMLYSLIIRTISLNIKSSGISRAIYTMSTTVAIGTALAYGISALSVALGNWKATFFIAAAVLLVAAGVWAFILTKIEKAKAAGDVEADDAPIAPSPQSAPRSRLNLLFISTLIFIGVTAIANGFIKDGVNNWLPKLLHDEFGVQDSLSIILTLLLPVFSILGAVLARKIYLCLQNHLLINGIFYGIAFALALGVYLLYPLRSVPLTMVLFIGLACMMAAINNVITSMFPLDNRDKLDSGLLAGLLDTLCYVGSSSAGMLLGILSRTQGWESVLILLFALALIASVICLAFSATAKLKRKN